MKRDFEIPEEVNERLWNWARCFRDRHNFGRCASAEKNFKPHSSDFAAEGWGEPEAPKQVPQMRSNALLEASATNDAVMKLNSIQKWSLTYYFCYPSLPRFVVLKCLRKYAGQRLNWKQYLEQVDLGRLRVASQVLLQIVQK